MASNASNVIAFKADLEEFAEKAEMSMNKLIRYIVLNLWTKITERTPVDTGRARASWNLGVGAINQKVPSKTSKKSEGKNKTKGSPPKSPENKFPSISKSTDLGSKPIYITSNLDYIQYLETGHSKQAVGGMVRISIAEIEVEISNALSQL